jgi:hypothetical protein
MFGLRRRDFLTLRSLQSCFLEMPVAVRTSRFSSRQAGKALIFTPILGVILEILD